MYFLLKRLLFCLACRKYIFKAIFCDEMELLVFRISGRTLFFICELLSLLVWPIFAWLACRESNELCMKTRASYSNN